MDNNDFEGQLRETPLGMPTAALRGRVLGQAKVLRRQRRRGRLVRGILLGSAALLVSVNLFFERAHEARVSYLVTGSAATRAVANAGWDVAALEMRAQLMNDLLRSNGT